MLRLPHYQEEKVTAVLCWATNCRKQRATIRSRRTSEKSVKDGVVDAGVQIEGGRFCRRGGLPSKVEEIAGFRGGQGVQSRVASARRRAELHGLGGREGRAIRGRGGSIYVDPGRQMKERRREERRQNRHNAQVCLHRY